MSILAGELSHLRRLCKRLEADIQSRGLHEGEPYLTAAKAAELLGVSTSTAHRTLRLLADSRWVVRRRKLGTFVGPRVGANHSVAIRTVHVLLPSDHFHLASYFPGLLIDGIRSAISDASVQFDFVPTGNRVAYVRQLLRLAGGQGDLLGIIAVSCPQEIYRQLAEAASPTVVMGSLYPGDPTIPSVDADHHEAGRLLAQHLIDAGHRRMAICVFSEIRPGDNHFYDGVSEALTAAQLPHSALRLQAAPRDAGSFRAAVRHLLQLPEPPTALMTVGENAAEIAASAVAELGLRVPGDVEIGFRDHATATVDQSPHVHVQPRQRFEEVAAAAGRMLDRLARGDPLDKPTVTIPVELRRGRRPAVRTHTFVAARTRW